MTVENPRDFFVSFACRENFAADSADSFLAQ